MQWREKMNQNQSEFIIRDHPELIIEPFSDILLAPFMFSLFCIFLCRSHNNNQTNSVLFLIRIHAIFSFVIIDILCSLKFKLWIYLLLYMKCNQKFSSTFKSSACMANLHWTWTEGNQYDVFVYAFDANVISQCTF